MKISALQSVIQACHPGAFSPRISAHHWHHYKFGPEEHGAILREITRRFARNTPPLTNILGNALIDLSRRCNKSDGGTHPSDKNRIKETFLRLHKAGVILKKDEVGCWLEYLGWPRKHAERLGKIAQKIGEGMKPVISDGPYYDDSVIDYWMNGCTTP
jgi:hypothetical protein